MSTDLREELDALADTQTFSPDPSAWDRGRRARRRDRALAVVAALVVVAGFGGAALWSTSDREARTASTDAVDVGVGAIPRRIADITSDLEPSPGLKVGRGAAAFSSTSQRVPVVITATDGVPQRLDLPGWTEDSQALALSPDGLRLAWQDAGTPGATISVLELMTGEVWSQEVHPDGDLSLRELTWSPDSVWLAWIGDTDGGAQVGRLRPVYAPMPLRWFVQGNVASVAVSDDARLVVSRAGGGLFLLEGPEPEPLADPPNGSAGLFSPDGRHIALRTGLGAESYTLDTATGDVLEHPFPDGTVDAAVVLPLGWLDDRHQVLQVWASEGGDAQLVVTTPRVGTASTWRGSVGSIDSAIAGRVTLAVELMPDLDGTSSQELTHDFGDTTPESPRPLGIELSLFIGLGVAAAIALLLGLRRLRRRPA